MFEPSCQAIQTVKYPTSFNAAVAKDWNPILSGDVHLSRTTFFRVFLVNQFLVDSLSF